MATVPPVCDFGWQAPDFKLKNVDGQMVSLADVSGENGTLVMFICNHCPYVKSILDRIIRDAKGLAKLGIGVVAINANDAEDYPEDSFEGMQAVAAKNEFPFPYLHDETQAVAKAYAAVCTPDFFGFNASGELQYRGRLDASRNQAGPTDLNRDLFEAMKLVVETGHGPVDQIPSMGCSIKWINA